MIRYGIIKLQYTTAAYILSLTRLSESCDSRLHQVHRSRVHVHRRGLVVSNFVGWYGRPVIDSDFLFRAALALPEDKEEPQEIFLPSKSHRITGTGDVKCATTHIPDIGRFVAEIVADDRTLNKYVFCWGDEKTQKEIWDIACKVKLELTGEPLKATPRNESEEEVLEKVKNTEDGTFAQMAAEYLLSICIRGDSTVENAKKPEFGGALDARELYPDLKVSTIEEVAKVLYKRSA